MITFFALTFECQLTYMFTIGIYPASVIGGFCHMTGVSAPLDICPEKYFVFLLVSKQVSVT